MSETNHPLGALRFYQTVADNRFPECVIDFASGRPRRWAESKRPFHRFDPRRLFGPDLHPDFDPPGGFFRPEVPAGYEPPEPAHLTVTIFEQAGDAPDPAKDEVRARGPWHHAFRPQLGEGESLLTIDVKDWFLRTCGDPGCFLFEHPDGRFYDFDARAFLPAADATHAARPATLNEWSASRDGWNNAEFFVALPNDLVEGPLWDCSAQLRAGSGRMENLSLFPQPWAADRYGELMNERLVRFIDRGPFNRRRTVQLQLMVRESKAPGGAAPYWTIWNGRGELFDFNRGGFCRLLEAADPFLPCEIVASNEIADGSAAWHLDTFAEIPDGISAQSLAGSIMILHRPSGRERRVPLDRKLRWGLFDELTNGGESLAFPDGFRRGSDDAGGGIVVLTIPDAAESFALHEPATGRWFDFSDGLLKAEAEVRQPAKRSGRDTVRRACIRPSPTRLGGNYLKRFRGSTRSYTQPLPRDCARRFPVRLSPRGDFARLQGDPPDCGPLHLPAWTLTHPPAVSDILEAGQAVATMMGRLFEGIESLVLERLIPRAAVSRAVAHRFEAIAHGFELAIDAVQFSAAVMVAGASAAPPDWPPTPSELRKTHHAAALLRLWHSLRQFANLEYGGTFDRLVDGFEESPLDFCRPELSDRTPEHVKVSPAFYLELLMLPIHARQVSAAVADFAAAVTSDEQRPAISAGGSTPESNMVCRDEIGPDSIPLALYQEAAGTLSEAEKRAIEICNRYPKFRETVTLRLWAKVLHCSPATVKKLTTYKTAKRAAGRTPKAVGLPVDELLSDLRMQQARDFEPSPLDDGPYPNSRVHRRA